MKTFAIFFSALALAATTASAQISVELVTPQDQFLVGEPLPVAVKITNRSGRPLHFGATADWLTFGVESSEGSIVMKLSEVPVMGEFDLESSQVGTKRVDIAPHFGMTRPGRYKITATVRVKDLSIQVTGPAKSVDIINASKLWAQEFGVPGTNGAPEMRKYTLEQASYLNSQMRLYLQLSDAADTRVIKTRELGPTVSFGHPDAQVDRLSLLHVLWQGGAQAFNYAVLDPEGNFVRREIYDDFGSRPRLTVNETGDVKVAGGTRRTTSSEIPDIKQPTALPPAPPKPAGN